MIVAIDGPAGSGKGTIAKKISNELNLINIDTGATYRCLALAVLENNIDINDEEKIIELSNNINIKMDNQEHVYLDDKDVTKDIRTPEVTKIVSPISSIIKVRKNMVELQRKMALNNNIVVEGRDITTVVFPNADVKIYLDAKLEERVNRRFKQNKELNINMSYEEIYENIKARDYNDMNKEVGALKRTEEQLYIDSTNLSIEEVFEIIKTEIEKEAE